MDNEKSGINRLKKPPAGRVGIIDEVRGLSIILMVLYHAAFDLVYIFGVNIPIFHHPIFRVLQPFFAGMFIFISGIACRYSHSNIKRGALCFGVALVMTIGTLLFAYDMRILFGILHFLGIAMLTFGIAHKLLDKIKPMAGIIISAVLFVLTYNLMYGTIGVPFLFEIALPRAIYDIGFLFPLGFIPSGFVSSDYFPLMPWLFLFFAGAYTGVYFKQNKMPECLYKTHVPFLALCGRYTMYIYILHQPVVFGLLWVVFKIVR